jgi:hypothetical protein
MSVFRSTTIAAMLLAAGCGGSDSDGLGPEPDTSLGFGGTWEGKWGMGNAIPSNDYTLVVAADHSLTVYEGSTGSAVRGSGSWTLDDGAFLGKYAFVAGDTLFVRGALANDGARMQGPWGRGTSTQGTYWGDKR